jgi:nucleoside-diphosphate-sugar epimerase
MRVFVAGATGVLGSAAVRRLLEAGHEVTGIARSAPKRAALTALGAGAAEADLFDAASVRRAVDGHDVVCNLATHIPVGAAAQRAGAWQENDRIRRTGSRILAGAAADCGAMRFVQEAVTFVYADGGSAWITEASPVEPSPSTQSSLEATEHAMGLADQYRFAVVLRFGSFYGRDGATGWRLDQARRGRPVMLGDPEGYISPLWIEDAAAAVVAAMSAPSGVYNVAGEPLPRAQWAAAFGTAAGASGPARFPSGLTGFLARRHTEAVDRSQRISSEAFHTATGWRARTAPADGLTALAATGSRS